MATVVNDLRLVPLPNQRVERAERAARRDTLRFFDETERPEFEWPSVYDIDPNVKFYLSSVIDQTVLTIFNEAMDLIQDSEEYQENYRAFLQADRRTGGVCGGFSMDTAILEDVTPLEQMMILGRFVQERRARLRNLTRTYCFKKDDDHVIPIYVVGRKNDVTTMSVRIGVSQSRLYKCPKYSELATNETLAQECPLLKSLEALEIVRQPAFSGATLLKGSSFDIGTIDNEWRFKNTEDQGRPYPWACVELLGQNKVYVNRAKEQSAGYNVLSLQKVYSDRNLSNALNFEDWAPEGYRDNADNSVSVRNFWNILKTGVRQNNFNELTKCIRKLFAAKVGPFTSLRARHFYSDQIFPVEELN